MKINTYQADSGAPHDLTELLEDEYGASKNFEYFIEDYIKSYKFCSENENIQFIPVNGYEGEDLVFHAALIIDKRLPRDYAFFGFFDCFSEKQFDEGWEFLLKVARQNNIICLKGPVNGSIWHQYRCIKETDNSDFFKTELPSKISYYHFLKSKKPDVEIGYYSAYRENFENVMNMIKGGYESALDKGFVVKRAEKITPVEFQSIALLSREVFAPISWGYTELTRSELQELYTQDKLNTHLNSVYLLYKEDKIIGYCSTVFEDDKTLMCKTICILPQYQGMGLGNAIAYAIHKDALGERCHRVIYALIREENNVKNFPKDDAVIFRRYAVFEFLI